VRRLRWPNVGRSGAEADLEALDVAVALQRRHHDVEQPQEEQERRGYILDLGRTTQLATDRRDTAHQNRDDGDERACAEDGDGEAECAGLDHERVALGRVVDGRDRPRDADAKEHVHCVAAGHVTDRRVSVLVVYCRHLARKRVCTNTTTTTTIDVTRTHQEMR